MIGQNESIPFAQGSVEARTVERQGASPRLQLLNPSCRILIDAVLTTRDETGRLFFDRASVARFKLERLTGWPQPLVVAVAGTAAGSTALFETSLVAWLGGYWTVLLPPILTTTEGGLYVGDLGGGLGSGIASWGRVWGGEAHIEPARYWLRRLRWNGIKFIPLRTLHSKDRHAGPEAALREFGVGYTNVALQFPEFDQLR